jgi:hypothetical protein
MSQCRLNLDGLTNQISGVDGNQSHWHAPAFQPVDIQDGIHQIHHVLAAALRKR